MIDWEEVIKAESTEELKEIKLWLFQENMRLKQESEQRLDGTGFPRNCGTSWMN